MQNFTGTLAQVGTCATSFHWNTGTLEHTPLGVFRCATEMRACAISIGNFLQHHGKGVMDVKNNKKQKTVAVNDNGLRIGEDHPNAKLTDADVERIRSMHEDGVNYETLADKFEVSKWAVGRICRYERRAQTPADFKHVHVSDCE
ncbi:hypothetical protein [Sulfurimicrobium lacus]|nr:hypothetical protein [Sulfurimicrobium lacus]